MQCGLCEVGLTAATVAHSGWVAWSREVRWLRRWCASVHWDAKANGSVRELGRGEAALAGTNRAEWNRAAPWLVPSDVGFGFCF